MRSGLPTQERKKFCYYNGNKGFEQTRGGEENDLNAASTRNFSSFRRQDGLGEVNFESLFLLYLLDAIPGLLKCATSKGHFNYYVSFTLLTALRSRFSTHEAECLLQLLHTSLPEGVSYTTVHGPLRKERSAATNKVVLLLLADTLQYQSYSSAARAAPTAASPELRYTTGRA